MANTLEKTWIYKVYRNSVYLGILPYVISDFGYRQDINTAGAQLNIQLGAILDTAPLPVDPIETEDGNPLETEAGEIIYIERQPDTIGNSVSTNLIRNGNKIDVYESSDYHPNGKKVFTGKINR